MLAHPWLFCLSWHHDSSCAESPPTLLLQALEKLQAKMSREGMERLLMERQVRHVITTDSRVGLRVRLPLVTFPLLRTRCATCRDI